MLGLYYRIWVDCITKVKAQPGNKENWPIGTMMVMSMAMTYNFVLLMILFQQFVLGYVFYSLHFSFLPKYWSNVASYVALFILPVLALNYLLIFRNKRYKKLLKRYPYYEGKLFWGYFVISMAVPTGLIFIGYFFFR